MASYYGCVFLSVFVVLHVCFFWTRMGIIFLFYRVTLFGSWRYNCFLLVLKEGYFLISFQILPVLAKKAMCPLLKGRTAASARARA